MNNWFQAAPACDCKGTTLRLPTVAFPLLPTNGPVHLCPFDLFRLSRKVRGSGLPAILSLLCLLFLSAQPACADATVTNMTQAALLKALAQGGSVRFLQDGSITLANTLLITNQVRLDASGHAVTLSGNNLVRLFTVQSNASLEIVNLQLSGGRSSSGGALFIDPGASVTLSNCICSGNSAVGANGSDGLDGANDSGTGHNGSNGGPGSRASGGAIYNAGNLALFNTQFLTNRAIGGDGGFGGRGGDGQYRGGDGGNGGKGESAFGGAIYNSGTLLLKDCPFNSNTAIGGTGGEGATGGTGVYGGLQGNGGAAGMASGAALYSLQSATVMCSTFSANSAVGGNSAAGGTQDAGVGSTGAKGGNSFGGAISLLGNGCLTNCTFSGNQAIAGTGGDGGPGSSRGGDGGDGGDAVGGGLYATGTVAVVNCTIAGCSVLRGTNGISGSGVFGGSDGSMGSARGGGLAKGLGTCTLMNSIFSSNTPGANIQALSGAITDAGCNLSSDNSSCLTSTNSFKNTDPKLRSLAANGGPTLTMELQTNSPALNRVPQTNSPAFDQRGLPRFHDAEDRGDIGSYEAMVWPIITTQPQSQTNAYGRTTTFAVSAYGEALKYQWRFNSIPIPTATTAGITLPAASITNAGCYDVVITNVHDAVTSAPAWLFVGPNMITQPTNQEVFQGEDATFHVAFQGSVPMLFRWFYNQTNLLHVEPDESLVTNAMTATFQLTIPSAQPTNYGTYSIVVSNAAGSITSSLATLTVDAPPFIVTQPQPAYQSALVGGKMSLSVGAIGPGPMRYQWWFNGTNPLSGARASTYLNSPLQLTNTGFYTVAVSNGYGSTTSSPIYLAVGTFTNLSTIPAISGYQALNVRLAGNYAYLILRDVTDPGSNQLQVLDIYNPWNPQAKGSLGLPSALSVFVSGPYAYVSCGTNGLAIVDVTDPSNPRRLGSCPVADLALSSFVAGTNAFVAAQTGGLQIVDVSSPQNPVPRAVVTNCNAASAVWVDGTNAFVGDASTGLHIIDISNPETPSWVTNCSTGGAIMGLQVANSRVYAAVPGVGLEVIDVSNPARPLAVATNLTPIAAQALSVSGGYAFIADGPGGIVALPVNHPTNSPAGTWKSLNALGLDVSGRYVYVAAADAGLVILDAGLGLHSAPQIQTHPRDLALEHGATASFSVTANGSAPLSFQWRKGGILLTNDTRIAGADTAHLSITGLRVADADGYDVVVSNSVGAVASEMAQLSVTGCECVLTPPGISIISTIFSGSFGVSTENGCDWTVATTNGWIHLTNSAGLGNESVFYTVDANAGTNSRVGTIIAGGEYFSITQAVASATGPMVQGIYRGLFFETAAAVTPEKSGSFKLAVTAAGKFSGNLQIGGARHSVSGQFDANAHAARTIPRRGQNPLLVEWQLDPTDVDRITGTVLASNETWTATLEGDRAVFDGRLNCATQSGRYTMILPGNYNSMDEPAGDSWGAVSVSKAGGIRLVAALADGTRLSYSTALSKNAQWPLYVSLYSGRGSLLGWLNFTNDSATPLYGSLSWLKPDSINFKHYPAGFAMQDNAWGSQYYTQPPKGQRILPSATEATLVLSGGNLAQPLTNHVTLGSDNRVSSTNGSRLTFALSSGTFRGSVLNQAGKPIPFTGVVLTNRNLGSGYFLSTNQSGRVLLLTQ